MTGDEHPDRHRPLLGSDLADRGLLGVDERPAARPRPLEDVDEVGDDGGLPYDDRRGERVGGRDHRGPAVDDDHPVEELVERAHLRAAGGDGGDVLLRGRAAARAVLVERAHPDAALERLGVAQGSGGDRLCVAAGLRLRGEQLLLRLGDERGEVGVDRLVVQVGERP
ncbi:hypothetical protein [Nocardioides sp. TF02-7]|uniref:hypothetical protein n=1 Tax=Nocardioides sp. TF02-7 TaxID=2917724 RepID=UPI001F059E13|nr:hypothetical protein [Nocardioides sp. TF02-7]UMG94383.1 hypothetical protein MF408_10570 [Nocardioides sp. TF02-7]